MKKILSFILILSLTALLFCSCGSKKVSDYTAEIVIKDYGTITLHLDGDTAPITVSNFVKLAESGFYDGLTFHRIMEGFMMQGGDPLGNGTGGSEETIKGEFSDNGVKNNVKHKKGVLSMVLPDGKDSANGEFFIVTETLKELDGKSTAFGKITDMSILEKILNDLEPDENGEIPAEDRPKITSISLHGHH